ncbi:hypothetical protein SDC9_186815 [bioreactor metagenome]|uniref:Uncharacterized protein n=1 Tax=bioreactor metagenome TaxID=1076179 RepID=A0A645HJY0_9ZZZZ
MVNLNKQFIEKFFAEAKVMSKDGTIINDQDIYDYLNKYTKEDFFINTFQAADESSSNFYNSYLTNDSLGIAVEASYSMGSYVIYEDKLDNLKQFLKNK